MKRNRREIAFVIGYNLLGLFFLGVLLMDLLVWRPG